MDLDPTSLTLGELAAAYRQGLIAPTEATHAYLREIDAADAPPHVYRVLSAERALAQARRAERLFASGVDIGPLQGIPIAIKDLLDTEGEVSAAGSKVLERGAPARQDAPAAARLDAAGAVFLGKTTMTELAFSGVGLNPHYGTPPNAIDAERIPGGSSSGSAVAVASRLACAAIGSDTGGSVRIPAAFNGIVGLKPTDGLVPTDGAVPLSTTLDTLGPLARTVEDAWAMFLALTARPQRPLGPLPAHLDLLAPTTVLQEELEPEVAEVFFAACERLAAFGHRLAHQERLALGEIPRLYRQFGSLAGHEALALYEGMIERDGDAMDSRVTTRIIAMKGRSSSDYIRLCFARTRLRRTFWEEHRTVDALLAPTVTIVPPRVADLGSDDLYVEVNRLCLKNTAIFNFLGGPAVSVPAGVTASGLPVGLMIATHPHQEEIALALARQFVAGEAGA